MSFVPSLCVECCRVHLVSLADATSKSLVCASCGGESRVVPGCNYGQKERDAFEELSGIVAEGNLTPMEAQTYGAEVEHSLWSGAYNHLLEAMCARLPGLLPHQVAAGKNSGAQRRIIAKLKTILDALATARRYSAEFPVAGSSAELARTGGG